MFNGPPGFHKNINNIDQSGSLDVFAEGEGRLEISVSPRPAMFTLNTQKSAVKRLAVGPGLGSLFDLRLPMDMSR